MSTAERPQPPQARLHIGRYQVVHPLGQGSMGEVLLAYDPVLDRNVAIKYLRRDLELLPTQRDSLVQRLWQEARASARLAHPNIVALHDMGEDDSLGPYLVFEYVEGPTLKERLRLGGLERPAAARLARELGEALATAHGAGVLHRDVKPENVILRRFGAKIADFGIARLPNSTLTRRGCLLGTPAYSAPETLEGAQFSPLSDQFSLAATLYEAVSGRRAFPGDDALQVASKVRLGEPRPFAAELGLEPEIDQILARGLAKNPTLRYPDCAAFGAALATALAKNVGLELLPPMARGLDTMSAVAVPVKSNRIGLAPALIGGVLFLAGAYFVLAPRALDPTPTLAATRAPESEQPPAPAETRSSWVAPKGTSTTHTTPLNVVKTDTVTRLKSVKPAASTTSATKATASAAKSKASSPRTKNKGSAKAFVGNKTQR
jgi:serine/threonine-protein kinase